MPRRLAAIAKTVAAGFGLAVVLAACQFQLIADGNPYTLSQTANNVTVTNASSGDNEHEFIGSTLLPTGPTATACATWGDRQGLAQAGFAFHVNNGTTAIVGEDNIVYDGQWGFPMIYFHGGTLDVGPGLDFGATGYLPEVAGPVIPLNVCEAIDANNNLAIAISKTGDPSSLLWTTTAQSGVITAPASWGAPTTGATGIYAAHVPAGTSESFENVTVNGAPLPDVINH